MPKVSDGQTRVLRVIPAAKYIGVSPWKLRQLVQRGVFCLVDHEENAPWRLDKAELDYWLDRNKTRLG
jgi:hypothetical protein